MNNITRTLDKVAILATAMIENRIYHSFYKFIFDLNIFLNCNYG